MAQARLCLVPKGTDSERLDGAWWPRSRSLARELPALIAAADLRFGRIDRVTVNSSLWPEPPRRIAVSGRTVDVGRFPAGERAVEVCVLSNNAGRRDLLVVPPDGEFAEAEMVLSGACDVLSRPVVEAWLLRAAADRAAGAEQRDQESAWDSEGGQGFSREVAS